jgi:hypothetical protein
MSIPASVSALCSGLMSVSFELNAGMFGSQPLTQPWKVFRIGVQLASSG